MLAKKFVTCSDEVWRLHNRKALDCLFFQGFSEEGHYRTHGTTRQGIYCCTPSGKFLASINTTQPRAMEKMLETALERWRAMPKKDRYLDYDPAKRASEIRRASDRFPADGLALRVFSRDMPRKNLPNDWRSTAWNVDSLWYRKDEAASMVPRSSKKGASVDWPKAVVERLVRHNLVDNVRGQTNGYGGAQVLVATLKATVTKTAKSLVTVELTGESRATTTGTWPESGKYDSLSSSNPNARGVRTRMHGTAVFDRKAKRFVSFELVAVGSRWGRTRYNFRQDDLDETPIGFVIRLDAEDPGNRVAPAEFGAYGW